MEVATVGKLALHSEAGQRAEGAAGGEGAGGSKDFHVEPNPEFFCARHMPRLRQPTLLWDSPRYSESVRKALTLNRHAHCPYADFGPKKRMVQY